MTKDIYKAVPGLSRALGTMNVERISTSMDAFEKLFEDLVCILLSTHHATHAAISLSLSPSVCVCVVRTCVRST